MMRIRISCGSAWGHPSRIFGSMSIAKNCEDVSSYPPVPLSISSVVRYARLQNGSVISAWNGPTGSPRISEDFGRATRFTTSSLCSFFSFNRCGLQVSIEMGSCCSLGDVLDLEIINLKTSSFDQFVDDFAFMASCWSILLFPVFLRLPIAFGGR